MSNDNFVKVFDVLNLGWEDLDLRALIGLPFILFGIIIVAFPDTSVFGHSLKSRISRFGILCCAILGTLVAALTPILEHLRHTELVQQNRCRVAEGPVENFVPKLTSGKGAESFSVAGVPFKYSDIGATDAFNKTSHNRGPIKGDSYVRICFDPVGNAILRLEIRERSSLAQGRRAG
jgi:hypothetical protein